MLQDQFVDAVQGPTNQDQAQGQAAQDSSSRSHNPNSSSRSGSSRSYKQQCPSWSKCTHAASTNNCLQHNQSHAGPVVPAPQVFYQNWIGKKPEFSGKPEEDAESHLLSTKDWMEAHHFPNEVKV